jgi:hypothetical protein
LRLGYERNKCTASTFYQFLLIIAAPIVSLFAALCGLANASTDQTIRNAFADTLPEGAELARRLNLTLVTKLHNSTFRKARRTRIDLALIS